MSYNCNSYICLCLNKYELYKKRLHKTLLEYICILKSQIDNLNLQLAISSQYDIHIPKKVIDFIENILCLPVYCDIDTISYVKIINDKCCSVYLDTSCLAYYCDTQTGQNVKLKPLDIIQSDSVQSTIDKYNGFISYFALLIELICDR